MLLAAAIAKHHRPTGFKMTQTYYITVVEVRRPEWSPLDYTQGVDRAVLLPEALKENPFPCLFQFLEITYVP